MQEKWGLGAGRGGGSGDAALGLAMGGAGRRGFRWQLWVDGSGREAISLRAAWFAGDGDRPAQKKAGHGGVAGSDTQLAKD